MRGTGAQGLPSQQPTYLTPGEQRREAADGPQSQMQILHHRGCVGTEGPVNRCLLFTNSREAPRGQLGGIICFARGSLHFANIFLPLGFL